MYTPTQSTLKRFLLAPLFGSCLLLVLLTLGQQGLNFWVQHLNRRADDWVTHTLLVEGEAERLGNALVDEERTSNKDDNKGQIAFNNSFNRLYNLMQDNPSQLQQLNKIKYIHKNWQRELNQKLLSASANSYTPVEKSLFDSLRTQIRILIQREEVLLAQRRYCVYKLHNINFIINILSTVALVVGVGFNLWLLQQRVNLPLRKLIKIGKIWESGQMEVRLGYSSADELGHLARVLDQMASEAHHRQQSIEVRNQHLEDMICALSHDLRTPLLATRTTLDAMIRGAFGSVNDTWREVFEEYRQANEDILKLVEVLLDVSRYEAGGGTHLNCEPLNWEKIFVKVIAQIKASSQSKLAITYKIPQSLPTVHGDSLEIQRVVQNLLDNAVRVSKPNKEIVLETASFGETQVYVCVRDQGSGIAPQEKEQIFHRFIQGRGRRGKSGLGLYLCRQIVEAHSGTIGVESSLGKGSTFWFTLPACTSNSAEFRHEKDVKKYA
ncbi:MAG: CHASE3 domain-containing protein [Nostocaceae cyanobacterium]|nr:CHASE3 domain-containing protein [Nostocaceae cyanobacterium]